MDAFKLGVDVLLRASRLDKRVDRLSIWKMRPYTYLKPNQRVTEVPVSTHCLGGEIVSGGKGVPSELLPSGWAQCTDEGHPEVYFAAA